MRICDHHTLSLYTCCLDAILQSIKLIPQLFVFKFPGDIDFVFCEFAVSKQKQRFSEWWTPQSLLYSRYRCALRFRLVLQSALGTKSLKTKDARKKDIDILLHSSQNACDIYSMEITSKIHRKTIQVWHTFKIQQFVYLKGYDIRYCAVSRLD